MMLRRPLYKQKKAFYSIKLYCICKQFINNNFIAAPMTDTNFLNPEDAAKAIMTKSFLHQRESLRESGTGSGFFHNNKIRSCSYVKEDKGGLKAVPFYDKRDNKIYPTQSTLRRSWTSSVHSSKSGEHAGGGFNKTLSVYDKNAPRNLMDISDFRPPYPNSSHIQIGNRGKKDPKHYISTYRNDMIAEPKRLQTNHPGILAFRNKWARSRLQK